MPDEFVHYGFGVPGVNIADVLAENAQSAETTLVPNAQSTETTSESPATMNQQLVAMSQGLHGCPSYLSPILAILFCTGCLGSLLGCLYAGLRSKRCRQNLIFTHLFLANFGSILFIPFNVAAKVFGHLYFQNEMFVVLSFITILSQVVVAFQLTLLATLRCKQILRNEEFVTTNCTKVVSFFIWIIALPIAALSILNAEIMAGTIKSDTFLQTSETQVLYIVAFVFGSLIPVAITVFCIVYSYRKHTPHGDNGKVDSKLHRDVSEVMLLCLLYIVCCVPVQILRLSPKQQVNGCGIPLNILICAAALFSVLSPILHIAYVSSSGRNGDELTLISKDSEVVLNVMNEFDEKNHGKDDEKAV